MLLVSTYNSSDSCKALENITKLAYYDVLHSLSINGEMKY